MNSVVMNTMHHVNSAGNITTPKFPSVRLKV